MNKKLADVVAELSQSGAIGILSVAVKNDSSLFKIFFRDGIVYHITHGSCSDRDCLAELRALEFGGTTFMAGANVDAKGMSMPPMQEIIAQLNASGKTVQWESRPGTETRAKPSASSTAAVEDGAMARLREELVNAIGPVASMVLEQTLATANIKPGQKLSQLDFSRLVHVLSERIPDDQKKAFLEKFGG